MLLKRVASLKCFLFDEKGVGAPPPAFTGRQRDPLPMPELSLALFLSTGASTPASCSPLLFLSWLNRHFYIINILYGLGQGLPVNSLSRAQAAIVRTHAAQIQRMFSRCFLCPFPLFFLFVFFLFVLG